MTLTQLKDIAEIVQGILTSAAILVAAVVSYVLFVYRRQR